MTEHLDRYETRPPHSRDVELFRNLRGMISVARPRAAALRKQVRGIDLSTIKTRSDLARIPIIRRSELLERQAEDKPFGGLAAARTCTLKHILVTPDFHFVPEGHAKDWWGAARALHAAGFRKGNLVINCFSYHLSPGGHMMETGAQALGCAVIPAGTAHVDHQINAIAQLRPTAYMGPADFLKLLLERARETSTDVSSLQMALLSGQAVEPLVVNDLQMRLQRVHQCYATPDLGVVAYQTRLGDGTSCEGVVVNENIIVEIVCPKTDAVLPPGEIGEVVVTRLNADYPLLRFGTGDLSAIIKEPSPCGRTNMRMRMPSARAADLAIARVDAVAQRKMVAAVHGLPGVSRLRLVVSRAEDRDRIDIHVEAAEVDVSLTQSLRERLAGLVRCQADVHVVPPGSLPDECELIVDERAQS